MDGSFLCMYYVCSSISLNRRELSWWSATFSHISWKLCHFLGHAPVNSNKTGFFSGPKLWKNFDPIFEQNFASVFSWAFYLAWNNGGPSLPSSSSIYDSRLKMDVKYLFRLSKRSSFSLHMTETVPYSITSTEQHALRKCLQKTCTAALLLLWVQLSNSRKSTKTFRMNLFLNPSHTYFDASLVWK